MSGWIFRSSDRHERVSHLPTRLILGIQFLYVLCVRRRQILTVDQRVPAVRQRLIQRTARPDHLPWLPRWPLWLVDRLVCVRAVRARQLFAGRGKFRLLNLLAWDVHAIIWSFFLSSMLARIDLCCRRFLVLPVFTGVVRRLFCIFLRVVYRRYFLFHLFLSHVPVLSHRFDISGRGYELHAMRCGLGHRAAGRRPKQHKMHAMLTRLLRHWQWRKRMPPVWTGPLLFCLDSLEL